MREFLHKTGQQWLLWRMAIVRCILFSAVTFGTALQTATVGVEYPELSGWNKTMLWVGIFVLWGNQMLSFLDKTAGRLAEGKPPIGDGNTEFLKKQPENG